MAYTLSLDECIGLTASLNKAVSSKDHGALKDMLASLKVADTKNKLKNISESKLGQTIAKLGKYDVDAEVKAMALEIKKMWAARAAAAKPAAAKPEGVKSEVKAEATASAPAAPAAPTAEVKEEVKPEVKAEEAAASSGVPEPVKLERRDSLSHVDWRPAAPTGDTVRDMVRTKLQEAFDKGKAENEKFLHEQVVDTAGMAELAENKMFETFDGVSKVRLRPPAGLAHNLPAGSPCSSRVRVVYASLRAPSARRPTWLAIVATSHLLLLRLGRSTRRASARSPSTSRTRRIRTSSRRSSPDRCL